MPKINSTTLIVETLRGSPCTVDELVSLTGIKEVPIRKIIGVLQTVKYITYDMDPYSGLRRYRVIM